MLKLLISPISSLQVFQHLVNLRELYLRKNRISDLKELKFLQNLPHLSILWIDENPIAKIPSYRSTVLSLLPNLVKLDDIAVTEAEREITRDSQATAIWSHDASSPRSDIDALAPKLNVEEKSLSPVKSSSARNDRLSPVIRWDASIDRPLMPNEVTTTTDEEDELHHVPKHLKPTWLRVNLPIGFF